MTKIEVTLHNKEIDELEVENYNPQEVSDIINGVTRNESKNPYKAILLGENIYSCVDIKSIRVIEEPEETTKDIKGEELSE